jgi:hypothetical protein
METYHDGAGPPERASPPRSKHSCQICTKTYTGFASLRTHYTLYHFWDQLGEEYRSHGEDCVVCCLRFPTHDHLLQHLGNFHCLIDPYLARRGLRMVSHEKTVRLRSWRCEICQENQSSAGGLKAHLAMKHFSRELRAEFPAVGRQGKERKCPKCFKVFEGSTVAKVVGHIGSAHDEVLKYAANYLDLNLADKGLLPVDDFDDSTVGVPFERERGPGGARGQGPFGCLVCQLCLEQAAGPRALKLHYLRAHYHAAVAADHPFFNCTICPASAPGLAEAHGHLATAHAGQVLLPLMEADGLWCGHSRVLRQVQCPRKHTVASSHDSYSGTACLVCRARRACTDWMSASSSWSGASSGG